MKQLRIAAMILVPLLVGAWVLTNGLADQPAPDLGSAVMVTGALAPSVALTIDDPQPAMTTTTATAAVPESTPPSLTSTDGAPEVVSPPVDGSGIDGAQPAGLYPTCPAGVDSDDDHIDVDDDDPSDDLDDICDD